MKKVIFIVLQILAFNCMAQISPVTLPLQNTQDIYHSFTLSTASFLPTYDAGTNAYAYQSTSSGSQDYYIYRSGGVWYLGLTSYYYSSAYATTLAKTVNTFSGINPQCKALWYKTNTLGSPIGDPEMGILSGPDCIAPVSSFTSSLHPDHIKIPSLRDIEIQAISPLEQSIISYNNTKDRLQMYNGYQWTDIISAYGKDTIHTKLTVLDTLKVKNTIKVLGKSSFGTPVNSTLSTDHNGIRINGNENVTQYGIAVDANGRTAVGINNQAYINTSAFNITTSLSMFTSSFAFANHTYDLTTLENDLNNGSVIWYNQYDGVTVNLPNPNTMRDRVMIFVNHSTTNLTFNQNIKTGATSTVNSIAPGERMMILARFLTTGGFWVKVL